MISATYMFQACVVDTRSCWLEMLPGASPSALAAAPRPFKIHQRGVQWKQGVMNYLMLCTSLNYNPTPIHCTPLQLHPTVMNTKRPCAVRAGFEIPSASPGQAPIHRGAAGIVNIC